MVQMKNWDPLVSRPALAMAGRLAWAASRELSTNRGHRDQCA